MLTKILSAKATEIAESKISLIANLIANICHKDQAFVLL